MLTCPWDQVVGLGFTCEKCTDFDYFGSQDPYQCDDFGNVWECQADASKSLDHFNIDGHIYRPSGFPYTIGETE